MGRKNYGFVTFAIAMLIVIFGLVSSIHAQCTSDDDCEDGQYCSRDTCDTSTGICGAITACPPSIDGCVIRNNSCDEVNDVCVDFADSSQCDDGDVYNGVEICDISSGECKDGFLPFITDLIAGGGSKGKSAMDVGDVLVWNDDENLNVRYIVDEPWCITETHLHVATSLADIPQKKGNPVPGDFTYGSIHDCLREVPYAIPLEWEPGTQLYIAAHAVVRKEVVIRGIPTFKYETAWGNGTKFPGKNWAMYFTYTIPNPAIDIEKFIDNSDADEAPGPTIPAGSTTEFKYVVTNTGNVPLCNILVVDDKLGTICTYLELNPGESFTCTKTATLGGSGQQSNIGTVTAKYGEDVVTDSDPAYYNVTVACTGSIGDFVWNDTNRNGIQDVGEAGLDGVTVNLKNNVGTTIATTTTGSGPGGSSGFYQFTGLCAGTYGVEAVTPAGYDPTISEVPGSTPSNDSNGSPATVILPTGSSSDQTIDFGFILPCTGAIGDFVWSDLNRNGIQDAGEPGLNGVIVQLKNSGGDVIAATTTANGPGGSSGFYQFTGLCAGTYGVEAVTPVGYAPTVTNAPGSTPSNDSNGIAPVTVPTDNSIDQTIDFGFFYNPA